MNGKGQSDRPVRPGKLANKGAGAPVPAERVEERGLTKENSQQQTNHRAQDRERLRNALQRVRQVAERDQEEKFTTLWHHVYDVGRLRETYFGLKRTAAPGVDRMTWQEYGEGLESNLEDLSARLKRGAYRARPVRRVYIPKPDGRQRPLGVTALEDKIVQSATVQVLNAVYETDFLGFSYGFRRGRGQHDALNALHVGLRQKKVNWVLDADIRGFFDAIDHEWLMKFLGHRIADQRVHRHVKKWLNAGVLEKGRVERADEGTPQGGSISPLLANIYLHYALDLWAHDWRKRQSHGDVIIVRYADDFVVGFQHRSEAERFLRELRQQLERFRLELHPEKTRLIEFGRFAEENRKRRGERKPETFDFLGFTHACSKTRDGRFTILRRTMRKRLRGKLAELRIELRRRMHLPIRKVGRWLRRVVNGHYQYYGVPLNSACLAAFWWHLTRMWRQVLSRRSQRGKLTWPRMRQLVQAYIPKPTICHPWPASSLLCVNICGRSPVR